MTATATRRTPSSINKTAKSQLFSTGRSPKARVRELTGAAQYIFENWFDESDRSTLAFLIQAITYAKEGLTNDLEDSMEKAKRLDKISGFLESKWRLDGSRDSFDEAIHLAMVAERVGSQYGDREGKDYHSTICHNLANLLVTRWQLGRNAEDLNEAFRYIKISLGSEGLIQNSDGDGDESHRKEWSSGLNSLADILEEKYDIDNRVEDLDKAWRAIQHAISIYPRRCGYYDRATQIRQKMYKRYGYGEVDMLEEAVDLERKAYDFTVRDSEPVTSEERDKIEANLSNILEALYRRWGRLRDINEAVQHGRAVVNRTNPEYPQYARRCSGLGNALKQRAMRTQSLEDLEESIEVGEKVLTAPSFRKAPGDFSMHYNNLALRLESHFHRTGVIDSLQRAIDYEKHALDFAITAGEKVWARINICSMMHSRARELGSSDYLSYAEGLLEVAKSDANFEQKCAASGVLADILKLRYDLEGIPKLLTHAARGQFRRANPEIEGRRASDSKWLEAIYEELQSFRKEYDGNDIDNRGESQFLDQLSRINLELFARCGGEQKLTLALSQARESAKLCPREHPRLCGASHRVGTCLLLKGSISHEEHYFKEAELVFVQEL
ncbi:uncharacterized protein PAC_20080 [Phialocephala subalpina]|uniref:Uncharacterized protein n=1 Tax=Phialocephala subalpina TaxID=576137 RepID=A0A1L7XYS8_9HELO|nr:uncharacterized protein PAC_20080 [Phialocephala subalpina]